MRDALDPAAGGLTTEPVRVVVVTYSPGEHLDRFLDSLAAATQRPLDIVVSDNGSVDGAPERAARQRDVEVRRGANIGYGGAANRGARGATGEFLVVANPDVVWEPGALDELLAAAQRWPDAGVLGPAILTPSGELYPSARQLPSISRGVGHAVFGWVWPTNPWTRAYRREDVHPDEGPTGWLSGSCMLLRTRAFEQVGGFDDGYFMYFEDLDLCARLGAAGWRSVYVPTAVVRHTGGHATMRNRRRMQLAHHRSAYRYLSKAYPGWRHLPLRAFLAVALTGRFVLALAFPAIGSGAIPTRDASELARSGASPAAPR